MRNPIHFIYNSKYSRLYFYLRLTFGILFILAGGLFYSYLSVPSSYARTQATIESIHCTYLGLEFDTSKGQTYGVNYKPLLSNTNHKCINGFSVGQKLNLAYNPASPLQNVRIQYGSELAVERTLIFGGLGSLALSLLLWKIMKKPKEQQPL